MEKIIAIFGRKGFEAFVMKTLGEIQSTQGEIKTNQEAIMANLAELQAIVAEVKAKVIELQNSQANAGMTAAEEEVLKADLQNLADTANPTIPNP